MDAEKKNEKSEKCQKKKLCKGSEESAGQKQQRIRINKHFNGPSMWMFTGSGVGRDFSTAS